MALKQNTQSLRTRLFALTEVIEHMRIGLVLFAAMLASVYPTNALPSASSFDSFLTEQGHVVERVRLIGEPTQTKLDTLLPSKAKSMYRLVLSCEISAQGSLRHCQADPVLPEQPKDKSSVKQIVHSVKLSDSDLRKITGRDMRLRLTIYLDDPTRALDRRNPWAVPTPPPPPPPPPTSTVDP